MAGKTSFTGITRKSLETPYSLQTIFLKDPSTLTVAAAQDRVVMGSAGEIVDVRAVVGTAPTGAAAIHDVNKNGTTVFSTQGNRPTIAIAATASGATVPDVKTFAAGDVLTIDCDQIGSGTAGSDAVVAVTIKVYLHA